MCPPVPRRWSHQKDFHLYTLQNFCTVNHMTSADTSFPHALTDHIFHLPSGLRISLFMFAYIYTFLINMLLCIPSQWLYQLSALILTHFTTPQFIPLPHISYPLTALTLPSCHLTCPSPHPLIHCILFYVPTDF